MADALEGDMVLFAYMPRFMRGIQEYEVRDFEATWMRAKKTLLKAVFLIKAITN